MDNTVDAKTVKSWISDDDEIAFIDVREIGQHTEIQDLTVFASTVLSI